MTEQYDLAVRSMILPGILDRKVLIDFLNKHHRTNTGNTTLLTEENFVTLSKVGTLCSYIMKEDLDKDKIKTDGQLIGTIFNTFNTISVKGALVKTCYTTYLCIDNEYRKKNYSRFLSDASDKYCRTILKIDHSYFLSHKSWWNRGLMIKSFYRVLKYDQMKQAGFGVLNKSKNKIKIFYYVKNIVGCIITSGIDIDICSRDFDIYWNPTDGEKDRYSKMFNFRTVKYENEAMVFSLFPLECLVNKSEKVVRIAMLSYFYVTNPKMVDIFFKVVLQIAKQEEYDCVYGYTLGDISEDVVLSNSSHITDKRTYLNFYNASEGIDDLRKINLILY